ncbi:MAG: hypothetical protein NUV80_06475 [Candidatus Berkelbacteria bacterium]|nr:hypothetical protein [Candidatus Berkelbacteria bacterium]
MGNHKYNWPDKKKIEAVTTYLVLGKIALVAAACNVPNQTLRSWKTQQWWKDLEKEIKQDDEQVLDSKLSKIIDKSLDQVSERIENGEFILDSRTGTVKRIPVKLRDIHKVSVELIDKRNLIRGKPTSITERVSTEDVIRKLAEEFKNFINRVDEKVIEHDEIEENQVALPEEWSPSVQNRESEIQLPSYNQETKSSAEQSASGSGEVSGSQYNDGRGPYTPFKQGREQYPFEPESTQPPQESFVCSES